MSSYPLSRRTLISLAGASPLLLRAGANARVATPAASPVSSEYPPAAERLAAMLSRLPGGVLDDRLTLSWVDIVRHYDQFPGSTFSTDPMLMPNYYSQDSFLMPGYMDRVTKEIGFQLDDIEQALVSGLAPHTVQLYQLSVNPENFIANWEAAGYEAKSNAVGPYWTIGEEGEIDLSNPVQRVALGRMNNLAILDGNVIAATSFLGPLTSVMQHGTNPEAPSVLDDVALVAASVPQESMTAWIQDGESLSTANLPVMPPLDESDDAVGPMPVIRTVSFGTSVGATFDFERLQESAFAYALVEADVPGEAERIAEVATWRWANMLEPANLEPYSRWGEVKSELLSDSLVLLTLQGEAAGRNLFAEQQARWELLPLMFTPPE